MILSGCGPSRSSIEPTTGLDSLQTLSSAGTVPLPQQWWQSFDDPALHTLIDSALTRNYNLAATWERFRQAQFVYKREKGNRWPQFEAGAQSAISRPQPDFAGGENIQFGASAQYEVDLWGRIGTGLRAEQFRARASLADYQTASLSLAAEVSLAWFRLKAARQQLALAEEQIQTNEDIFRLIRARFGGGQVRAVDILRQQQLLESTRNQRLLFMRDVALLENQLAVLLGRQPQAKDAPEALDFPDLPELPATGLPLELVRRRPDIQQAYLSLQAADRDYATAVRAKYPRLSLRLSGQQRANDYESLFQEWAYTLAGNIVAPLFYGGALSAEANRNKSVRQEAIYNYGQSVLTAFREVEDAIVREEVQTTRLATLEKQLTLAQKTNGQLRNEFLNGFSPYLDVLIGLDQEQQLKRDLIDARLEQLEIRVGLYRALAGPFETQRELALTSEKTTP
ncbi:TolC family protein [Robiginitalea sp. SC105]|uniref:TolC family protein n=1 Tax=Robiginitalea sp. SC105 TaxID=2762332 RepID=UPI00163B49E1|nr:TolC family protein [Robiginitalea sp. SC105]MBC2838325.1 TolC family protein [Robiginitalea sp. SC105]